MSSSSEIIQKNSDAFRPDLLCIFRVLDTCVNAVSEHLAAWSWPEASPPSWFRWSSDWIAGKWTSSRTWIRPNERNFFPLIWFLHVLLMNQNAVGRLNEFAYYVNELPRRLNSSMSFCVTPFSIRNWRSWWCSSFSSAGCEWLSNALKASTKHKII